MCLSCTMCEGHESPTHILFEQHYLPGTSSVRVFIYFCAVCSDYFRHYITS